MNLTDKLEDYYRKRGANATWRMYALFHPLACQEAIKRVEGPERQTDKLFGIAMTAGMIARAITSIKVCALAPGGPKGMAEKLNKDAISILNQYQKLK